VLLLVVQTSNLLEVLNLLFEETLMLTRMRFCTLYSEVQDINVYMEETHDLYCSRCNDEKYVFISSTHLQGVPDHIIVIDRPAKIRKNTGFLQVEFEDGYLCYIKFRITENIRYLGRYRIV